MQAGLSDTSEKKPPNWAASFFIPLLSNVGLAFVNIQRIGDGWPGFF